MEVQATQGFGGEIQEDTKEADTPEPVHDICGEGTETKLGNQGMDKLLRVRHHENSNERRGRTFARLRVIIWKQWKVPKRRQWGIAETGNRKRYGEVGLSS